ncbi:uncharacterized protein LOC131003339 [Salvia miltiorrhiza]|uniref:uncharacterized protein LOC131003339 n=1 Tax=Salvia miltiorrhiza TaxID=226208 RepID=UPI0025ACA231|nr:uncharacterized protein LOC131003339 [Salvia miltiorrhiza]
MESPSKMFDNVKFEKEKAIARFNRVRRVMRLLQIIQVAGVFAAVSWCSVRAPAVAMSAGASLLEFSTYLFNHHVAFLIGNAIIVLLFMLCRQSDGGASASSRRDLYDDYAKYSDAARSLPQPEQREEVAAPPAEFGGGNKQIVAVIADEASASSQCDDVAAAIEKAARQIKKFQRNRSEMMLRREIAVRPELRRSETENHRKLVSSGSAEIENLSNEEFRRRVDAFIDKHWIKTTAKLEGHQNHGW